MARKTILFVNTGYSDLQFLARCCDNKGSFFARVELDKTNLRKVHEALREERLPYALFNGEHSYEGLNGELRDPARLRNIRAVPFQYNEAGQILLEAPKEKPYEKEPNEIDLELVEKDKKIVIVPAKLWEITHKLLYSGREVIGAYIFQTERNESIGKRHYAQEPVACGSVLAR